MYSGGETTLYILPLKRQCCPNTLRSGGLRTPAFLLTTESQAARLLTLDSDTFNIHHIAAVMVGNLGRLLGINLPDKAVMYLDFPRVGFPV